MICNIGTYLPKERLGNEFLAELSGKWTAEEIFKKTGIHQRCVAGENQSSLDLGEEAVRDLMSRDTSVMASDFLLFCTEFPEFVLPPNSTLLQHRIGFPTAIGALDYSLACSGYVYGLFLSDCLLRNPAVHRVLLVTADTYTKHLDPNDSATRSVFGDAGTATILSKESCSNLHSFTFGTDGENAMSLSCNQPQLNANRDKPHVVTVNECSKNIKMNGPEVFNFTLRVVPDSVQKTLSEANMPLSEIDYFVLHQANGFMLEHLRRKIGIPKEKFVTEFSDTGNTVASSIPLALRKMMDDGRLSRPCRLLLSGFGVGLSWASCILDWEPC